MSDALNEEKIEKIRKRQERVAEMMKTEPQGMVSKPHICWATDALSHAERDITFLLDLQDEKDNPSPGADVQDPGKWFGQSRWFWISAIVTGVAVGNILRLVL